MNFYLSIQAFGTPISDRPTQILRLGFRPRNEELYDSGCSGSEGQKSPFRGAGLKLASYSDFLFPKPTPSICWYPQIFAGHLTETNSISARAGVVAPVETSLTR